MHIMYAHVDVCNVKKGKKIVDLALVLSTQLSFFIIIFIDDLSPNLYIYVSTAL